MLYPLKHFFTGKSFPTYRKEEPVRYNIICERLYRETGLSAS